MATYTSGRIVCPGYSNGDNSVVFRLLSFNGIEYGVTVYPVYQPLIHTTFSRQTPCRPVFKRRCWLLQHGRSHIPKARQDSAERENTMVYMVATSLLPAAEGRELAVIPVITVDKLPDQILAMCNACQ